jgi:hypothetical protein
MIDMDEFIRSNSTALVGKIDGNLIYKCRSCNKSFKVPMADSLHVFNTKIDDQTLHNHMIRHICNSIDHGVADLIGWEKLLVEEKNKLYIEPCPNCGLIHDKPHVNHPKRCDNNCRFWTPVGVMDGICSFAASHGFYNGSISSSNYLCIQSVGCDSYIRK